VARTIPRRKRLALTVKNQEITPFYPTCFFYGASEVINIRFYLTETSEVMFTQKQCGGLIHQGDITFLIKIKGTTYEQWIFTYRDMVFIIRSRAS